MTEIQVAILCFGAGWLLGSYLETRKARKIRDDILRTLAELKLELRRLGMNV